MNGQVLAYFGHHKCASSWLTDIVLDVCSMLQLRSVVVHNDMSCDHHLGRFVTTQNANFLLYINANTNQVRLLPDFRGFHVVRDPRDLVVSAYFSHRFSHPLHPWLELHRERLQGLNEEEGLLAEMEFPITRGVLAQMRDWDYQRPNVMEIKMEELVVSPWPVLRSVFEWLNLRDREGELSKIVERHDYSVKAGGRARGEEDQRSHYRKGTCGDWKNYFSKSHSHYFKVHFQDILEKLKYENSASW